MIRRNLDEIYENLKNAMDSRLQASKELQDKIKKLEDEIQKQEEDIFLLDAMKAQLLTVIKENREELKALKETREKSKITKVIPSESDLRLELYDLENERFSLAAKQDKTEDDFKRMKQIDEKAKEIIRTLGNL